MVYLRNRGRPQFSLRKLLAGVTWLALVIAICVGQQQAASRQRAVIEKLKASGVLPMTIINGQPVPLPHPPSPPVKKGP